MKSNSAIKRAVRQALLVGAMAAGTSFSTYAAEDATPELKEVVVTGSSIKGLDVETSLPVSVMSRDKIAASGVDNMEQLVQTIPSIATIGATRASDSAGAATYGLSSISLRGLGENRTLVLVNGRRLAAFPNGGSTAAPDINAIPLAAIERVEVLRDGASSSYGSDAVAGVVNFILRKNFDGIEVTADVGKPTETGGGGINRYSIIMGKNDLFGGKLSAMFGADLDQTKELIAADRPFSASGNNPPYYSNSATPSGRIEGIFIPGETIAQNSRNANADPANGTINPNPLGYSSSGYGNPYAPDRCGAINMFNAGPGGVKDGATDTPNGLTGAYPNCNFDSAPYADLVPETKHYDFFANLRGEISSALALYFEGSFSKNEITTAYQPSPVRIAFLESDNAFANSNVDPALLIFPSNPNYQSIVVPYLAMHPELAAMNGQPLAVSARAFLAGNRTDIAFNQQSRYVIGAEGNISGWDYDVAAAFNESKVAGSVGDGYFSQLGLARVLNNSNWNPWAVTQSADITSQIDAIKYHGPTVSGDSKEQSLDAKASGSLMDMKGGPLQLAVGMSGRRDTYVVTVPDILGQGDIAGLGGATLPEDSSRTITAVYSEINLPWTKEFQTDASVRYDHYSDVGGTTNGKLSLRYQPVDQVLLRGAVGTGFRAPTLVELHLPTTTGTSEQFIDPLFASDGEIQVNSLIGGNESLRPEKSKQYSLGIVLTPLQNLKLSFDYFAIKIDDYITHPSALGLVNATRAGHPLYGPGDVIFAPDGEVDTVDQHLHNAGTADVRGVDVDINWSDTFAFGKVGLDLAGTYTSKYDLTTLAGTQDSVGTIVQADGNSPLDIGSGVGVVTSWKHTLTASWSMGRWGATIDQNYYSGYRDKNDLNDNPHHVPGQALYDVQLTAGLPFNAKLAIGARNVLNTQPPLYIFAGNQFQYGYDTAMYDPRARFIYARLTWKFL